MKISEKTGIYVKSGLVALALFVTGLPLLNQLAGTIFKIKPLQGSYTKAGDISFSLADWFSGHFQEVKDASVKDNFMFHDWLVRCNNEIEFRLFKKVNASDVIIGKDMYLYEKSYIDSYYGRNFIGEDSLKYRLKLLKAVQDTLAKHNKLFILVLAAGKASFYPEYIPDHMKSSAGMSNYECVKKLSRQLGINTIDFNAYFVSQKKQSKYPLFPKYGIHWSFYGSSLAYDSMSRYIETKLGVNLPDLVTKSIYECDTAKHSDADLIEGMNLLTTAKSERMAYPENEVRYQPEIHNKNLSIMVVSDSFWWETYVTGWVHGMFKDNQFWYYNREVYSSLPQSLPVFNADYYTRIQNTDVIVLLQTEATLRKFAFGFDQLSYEVLCKPNVDKANLQKIKEQIVSNPDWYQHIVEKATKWGKPVDSVITSDAKYVYEEQKLKK